MDLNAARQKMEKALEAIREDFATIQVGRARPALVEKIKVEAYPGTILELRELANILTSDPQQLVISPWDKTVLPKISQALSQSGLNLSPIADGEIIRLKIPPLVEERRKELIKLIQMKTETGRKMIRMIRNEIKNEIEALKESGGFSKDDIFRGINELQELHDEFIDKIGKLAEAKEKEVAS